MKKCSYCGAEYPDDAAMCSIDHTPFTTEAPSKFIDLVRWTPKSPWGLALTSGLASFLICTGIFFATGRAERDIMHMHHVFASNDPDGYSVFVYYHLAITWTLFCLGALSFTFFVCYSRCLKESHIIIATIVTIVIIASSTVGARFSPSLFPIMLSVPVVVLGMNTGLSAFFYIGAALQIFAGAWLLGWFRQRKPPNNALEPTATAP
jgi:hypothetical protein